MRPCDVQADGGKKNSLSVSYSVSKVNRRSIFLGILQVVRSEM